MAKIREEFAYLNHLRKIAATNMFGAAPYVAAMFGLSKSEARKVLSEWMDWIDEDPKRLDL